MIGPEASTGAPRYQIIRGCMSSVLNGLVVHREMICRCLYASPLSLQQSPLHRAQREQRAVFAPSSGGGLKGECTPWFHRPSQWLARHRERSQSRKPSGSRKAETPQHSNAFTTCIAGGSTHCVCE